MKLYDECFEGVLKLLEEYPVKKLKVDLKNLPKESDKNEIIFANECAFELGSKNLPAISSVALTDDENYVSEDEILLIGNDLPDIKSDCAFARIALMRVDEKAMGSGDALYQAIRKIEFARYHIHPSGYMIRISAFTHREAARVGKKAIKEGLDFSKIGSLFINKYKERSEVKAVKLLFVTAPDFPYGELESVMQKSESITTALDHLMKNIKMDCASCNLKQVCDEVENLITHV